MWKKEARSATLEKVLKQYCKIYFKIALISMGRHREEQLLFLNKIIKKKLPERIIPLKVWFFAVEKAKMFNPLRFEDFEKYLETLMIWRKREMKKFIEDNPRLLIKGYRHKKVYSYRKPLRV